MEDNDTPSPVPGLRDSAFSESAVEDLDGDLDPDRDIRERQEREAATVFIGFGNVGFYSPSPYFLLPFAWEGTVLKAVTPLMLLSVVVAVLVTFFDLEINEYAHQLLGAVLSRRIAPDFQVTPAVHQVWCSGFCLLLWLILHSRIMIKRCDLLSSDEALNESLAAGERDERNGNYMLLIANG